MLQIYKRFKLRRNIEKFSLSKEKENKKTGSYWCGEGVQESGLHEAERVSLMIENISGKKDVIHFVDVGCGEGRLAEGIVKTKSLKKIIEYVGTDVRKEAIDYCLNHFSQYSNFEFIFYNMHNSMYSNKGHKDISPMPFTDESKDIVYLWSVFSHLIPDDIRFYLSEFSRIMKKDSLLFVTFHESDRCKENPEFNPEWWRFEDGNKIEEGSSELLVVAYHPSWIENILEEYKFRVIYKHYPIYASNGQTGYYLQKMGK